MRENFDSEQELQFEALNLCFEANLPCAQEIKQRFHLSPGHPGPKKQINKISPDKHRHPGLEH